MWFRRLSVACLCAVAAAGCGGSEPEPEPEAVEAPKARNAQAIAADLNRPLDPVLNGVAQGLPLGPRIARTALSDLQSALAQVSTEENAPEAINQTAQRVRGALTQAETSQLWEYVVFCADAYDILKPGDAAVAKARKDAQVQLARPRVTFRSYMSDVETGDATVFLRVVIPTTGESENVQVRVGEQFMGLELMEIIGHGRAIRLKYLETGEEYEIVKD